MSTGFDPAVLRSSALSPLELASGMARGRATATRRRRRTAISSRQALERSILRALQRPPCVVSFSGGRDSSTVLAVATQLARREGLPPPVPVSLRFPAAPPTDESRWQQEVVEHLGITEWERVELHDELDTIGPYAERLFEHAGLLWPFNSHFHLPIADLAPQGSVLTGFGGDELMATGWVWGPEMALLSGDRRPRPRDLVRLAAAVSPRPVRSRFLTRRMRWDGPPARPWLTAEADATVTELMIADMLEESVHWGRAVRAWIGMRYRVLVMAALDVVASTSGAVAVHPLADDDFLTAIAAERGRHGFLDRTDAVRYVVGDLLPTSLISRSSKASFGGAFWNDHAVRFAREWDGTGLDESLVDPEYLQRLWRQDGVPDGRTRGLFQAAWLASGQRRSRRQ